MLIEVFLRRNFGRRYFSLPSAFFFCIALSLIYHLSGLFNSRGTRLHQMFASDEEMHALDVQAHNQTFGFYVFLAVFLCFCFARFLEMNNRPSEYDFKHYSRYSGDQASWLLKLSGYITSSPRTVEIGIEPALGFFAGLFINVLGLHAVGMIVMVCSVLYSLSYWAAYQVGDDFVFDKVDERIWNENLERAFVDGLDVSQTNGARFYGRRPTDPETRRELAKTFVEDEDGVDVE